MARMAYSLAIWHSFVFLSIVRADTGNDNAELRTIKKAMKRIRRNTCIRFRKRKSEGDYVDIQNEKGRGCFTSGVGRQTGRNVLMLDTSQGGNTLVFSEIPDIQHSHVFFLD
ncbi:hypothetical protein KIN20_018926 [Parelaphostrongylus tenuis]|uniref:Peptidase M12A domain-containing protein n=1 Tax=Parelaphostrongylus tenuis TaxID=148309 RepID=A0AAD5N497_PARTN|nr:hypothetical protein KIN20_018926 [Parelaphostrongylus tenuis]